MLCALDFEDRYTLKMNLASVCRLCVKILRNSIFSEIKVETEFREHYNKKINPIRGWLSFEESYLLYSSAKAIMPDESVIEIGSYEGRSTVVLGLALKNGRINPGQIVYSIDPHTGDITEVQKGLKIDTWNNFISNVNEFDLQDVITPIRLTSDSAISQLADVRAGLLFIDGWHSYEAVRNDMKNYLPLTSAHSIIIFDDWEHPEILKAILEAIQDLPDLLGFVGKDLVFSNSRKFNRSRLGRTLKARSKLISLFNFIRLDNEFREILAAKSRK
jgi:predicted O-methyltransferase YrrM